MLNNLKFEACTIVQSIQTLQQRYVSTVKPRLDLLHDNMHARRAKYDNELKFLKVETKQKRKYIKKSL